MSKDISLDRDEAFFSCVGYTRITTICGYCAQGRTGHVVDIPVTVHTRFTRNKIVTNDYQNPITPGPSESRMIVITGPASLSSNRLVIFALNA